MNINWRTICIYTCLNENAWRNMLNIFNKGFANNQPMCDILYIYYLEIIYQFKLVLATGESYPHGMPPYAMCIPL